MSGQRSTPKKTKRSLSSNQFKKHETKGQREQLRKGHENNIQLNTMKQSTLTSSLHYYLNAPKQKFKQMFKTSLVNGEDIIRWCHTDKRLDYIYQHARLLDRLSYLKSEEDLWENYTKYAETYHCWTSQFSIQFIRQNRLTADYLHTQKFMEKYRKSIQQQRQETEENVEQHRLLLKDYQRQNSMVNEDYLWAAILALVRKGQHKLSKKYKYRKTSFKNSAKDHFLVKTCYDHRPTQDEMKSIQKIWRPTVHQYKSQATAHILKLRLYKKRLPKSFDYFNQPLEQIERELSKSIYKHKRNIRTTLLTRYKKIIAQNKSDLMKFHISMAEAAVRAYQQSSDDEKNELFNRMMKDQSRQALVNPLKEAIEQRQKHIQQQIQYSTKRRLSFFYHRSDDRPMKWNRRSFHLNPYWDILPSSPIIEVFSQLTSEQLALLAYGPKYVPPCQSRFFRKKKRERIIENEHQTMINTISEFFRQHCFYISEKRLQEFSIDLKQLLQHLYTKEVARKLFIRAKREHRLIIDIRRYLRQNQHITLRRTDKSRVFHLGDANDYQGKVLQYMQDTEAYEEIISGISPLAESYQQVISLLDYLYRAEKPSLSKKQYEYMYPKFDEIELGHLYFIPKPHKVRIMYDTIK